MLSFIVLSSCGQNAVYSENTDVPAGTRIISCTDSTSKDYYTLRDTWKPILSKQYPDSSPILAGECRLDNGNKIVSAALYNKDENTPSERKAVLLYNKNNEPLLFTNNLSCPPNTGGVEEPYILSLENGKLQISCGGSDTFTRFTKNMEISMKDFSFKTTKYEITQADSETGEVRTIDNLKNHQEGYN